MVLSKLEFAPSTGWQGSIWLVNLLQTGLAMSPMAVRDREVLDASDHILWCYRLILCDPGRAASPSVEVYCSGVL